MIVPRTIECSISSFFVGSSALCLCVGNANENKKGKQELTPIKIDIPRAGFLLKFLASNI